MKIDNYGKDNLSFLSDIRRALGPDCLMEVCLRYNDIVFSIEPVEDYFLVFGLGEQMRFSTVDDVFTGLKIQGKPFLDCLSILDYA